MHGRDIGKEFESLFEKRARFNGLLPIKNHIPARYNWNGRLKAVPGELDYRLITTQGRVGYFDAKSFGEDHFTYSKIDAAQVERAVLYNNWQVPAGFVVFLREMDRVIFYAGHVVARNGPGTRFLAQDGLNLGSALKFDLKLLFA